MVQENNRKDIKLRTGSWKDKIYKPLARLRKKERRKRIKINKSTNERGDITTDNTEIQES